jgi:outer membrane protein assembly factor BamB
MRTRTVLVILGLVATLGIGGYLAYRSPLVRSWFGRDADDPREKELLAGSDARGTAPAPAGTGWPQWRGPHRDGVAPQGPLRTDWDKNPPKQLWKADCGGGYSSLAVVGGKVYTQDKKGDSERVICLDAESGKLAWEYAYPVNYGRLGYAAGPRATPTVEGNRLYAVGAVGKFVCLELPAPGGQPKLLWEHDLIGEFRASLPGWGIASSPLIDGELVIVQPGGRDGSVAAFDKTSGELRWKAGSNPNGYSSPVATTVGGVRVVYAFTGDALLCVRATDGNVLDEYTWSTQHNGNIATPIVHDQWVFISSGYNKGCALLRAEADGDRVRFREAYARSNRVMRNHHSTCVFLEWNPKEWYLFGFDNDQLRCVDFKTGEVKEDWESKSLRKGSLILAGKHLIVLGEDGKLSLVEATPDEFRMIASLPSGLGRSEIWALPVLVDGRLYLRDGQQVLCLDVRP